MKELSIEEKAKRYDEAIEIAKEINNEHRAQPQPKQEWSKEDDRHLNSVIKRTIAYGDSSIHGLIKDDIDWLKSLKDRVQPKQEWADEYLNVVRTIELIRSEIQKQKQNLIDSIGRTSNKELNLAHHILCVLESLINAIPEKSIDWTEDDENKVTLFMQLVEGCDNYEELSNWLKSLRPQKQWKPSDEQMEALWNVYQGGKEQAELAILYNDLKKLREK